MRGMVFTLLSKLWRMIMYIVNQYLDDNCSSTAASLSYSTLLSIVPLMLVMLSLASHIPEFIGGVRAMEQFMLQNFIADAAGTIGAYFDAFLNQVTKLSWTNVIAFIFTGLLLLYNMVCAFNWVWGVKMDWQQHFTIRFLLYFSLLLLAPLLLSILAVLISYVASLSFFANKDFQTIVTSPLVFAMPYLSAFVTFTFLNWALPTCKVKLRCAALAGLITTCFFELLKYLFALYLHVFPTYQLIYGALAVIPIFILWVYLTWVLVLLGAILCKGLQDHFDAQKQHVMAP